MLLGVSMKVEIRMPKFTVIDVVTAFLEFDGLILILRRSTSVRTMKEKWGAVSGYLEKNDPLTQAIIEINEETGLDSEQNTISEVRQCTSCNRPRKSRYLI